MMAKWKKALEFQSLQWTLSCKDCDFSFLNDNVEVSENKNV